ncbi:MAG TPA: iron-sulfur cluster assembly scaffold protein [Anaerolineaceae bacterium]|nr:iron-sulfur cluster assembly scaffold protein [Anaerolineaceae bacterium]
MSDLDRASQMEFILDHYQNPRNHGELPDADASVQGGLPGCSDVITIYLKVEDDKITDIRFTGEGCTISQASASALTEEVKGMPISAVDQLDHGVMSDLLGEEVVRVRPRCATLSLDTLRAAVYEYRKNRLQAGKGQ